MDQEQLAKKKGGGTNLCSDLPELRVLDARHEHALRQVVLIANEGSRLLVFVPLPELCRDSLSVPVVVLSPPSFDPLVVSLDSTGVDSSLCFKGSVLVDKLLGCRSNGEERK
jgi:hypothetical protein